MCEITVAVTKTGAFPRASAAAVPPKTDAFARGAAVGAALRQQHLFARAVGRPRARGRTANLGRDHQGAALRCAQSAALSDSCLLPNSCSRSRSSSSSSCSCAVPFCDDLCRRPRSSPARLARAGGRSSPKRRPTCVRWFTAFHRPPTAFPLPCLELPRLFLTFHCLSSASHCLSTALS